MYTCSDGKAKIHVYTVCFLQAITYLQGVARLKGSEGIEEGDVLEIAGVKYIHVFLSNPKFSLSLLSRAAYRGYTFKWSIILSLIFLLQIVPEPLIDSLFKACYSDSYERVESAVKVGSQPVIQVHTQSHVQSCMYVLCSSV